MSGVGEPYTCGRCGGSFTKTWSDEEAMDEARSLFPAERIEREEDQAVVCDPCFREIMEWAKVNAPELLRQAPPALPGSSACARLSWLPVLRCLRVPGR